MMLTPKRSLSLFLLAMAGVVFGPDSTVEASVVAPGYCSAFMDGAVSNNKGAYCVSNFGWSDTWYSVGVNGTFPPFPDNYDKTTDLFSGDDSPNLRFRNDLGELLSGKGWLSPIMDAGNLFPSYDTGSAWQVANPLEYVGSGTDTLQSSIFFLLDGGQLDVKITTHIEENGEIVQTFDIANNSQTVLTDVFFSDYFNFHPNGSDLAATQVGTTTFSGASITTSGDPNDPSFIGNGRMKLVQNGQPVSPDAHDIGVCSGSLNPGDPPCISTIADVESGAFNNANQAGPGDTAGVLGKALGNNATFCAETSGSAGVLCPGETVSIKVVKTIPEPDSLALVFSGISLIWWRSRRSIPQQQQSR